MEYKAGDIVLMKSAGTGNGLPWYIDSVVVELLDIDPGKNPTGLFNCGGNVMVKYDGKYTVSHTNLILKMIKPYNQEPIYEIY